MPEDSIAEQLRQNIPLAPAPVTPEAPAVLHGEQSSVADTRNELVLLKLGNHLGLENALNPEVLPKLNYIYDQVAELTGSQSYDSILASVNDLLVREGFAFREDRYQKLWLWLKLNQERLAIEKEIHRVKSTA